MSAPVWLPSHAYLVNSIVSPSTSNGIAYFTRAPGTSGLTEPTWPTNGGSVVDGTITWDSGTTFREQFVNAMIAFLLGFAAANPTLLRKVYAARPGSLAAGDLPAAFIGDRDARLIYYPGPIQWNAVPSVTLVDATPDSPQASLRMDTLVDGLVMVIASYPHLVSATSVITLDATNTVPFGEGPTELIAEELHFAADIAQGRVPGP